MEPNSNNYDTQQTQLKATALWIWAAAQLIWNAIVWSIRATLIVAVGALYLARQVVYGTLSFLMPADRFDRAGKYISDSVAGGLASIEIDEDEDEEDRNGRWVDEYDEIRDCYVSVYRNPF